MLKAGAKWSIDDFGLKSLRRDLAGGESAIVIRVLDLLDKYEALSAPQLHELTRTPAVRKVLNGYTKPRRDIFGSYNSPQVVVSSVEPAKTGYWKRHWSQK